MLIEGSDDTYDDVVGRTEGNHSIGALCYFVSCFVLLLRYWRTYLCSFEHLIATIQELQHCSTFMIHVRNALLVHT